MNFKLTYCIIYFSFSLAHHTYCQSDNQTHTHTLPSKKFEFSKDIIWHPVSMSTPIISNLNTLETFNITSVNNKLIWQIENNNTKLFFNKDFTSTYYQNFGAYTIRKGLVSFISNKLTANIEAGLAVQSTNISPEMLYIQLIAGGQLQYRINSWLYLYSRIQYVSRPINNQFGYINSGLHMNPLFINGEIEAGAKLKYKMIEMNVGTKTLIDTQFNKSKPIHLMNSNVNIGF